MKDQKIELPELPSWHEAERNCLFDAETPLDRFIFDNEPSECDDEWRQQLSAVMRESIAPYAKRIAELEAERKRGGEPVLDRGDLAFILDELRQASLYRAANLVADALSAPHPVEPDYRSDWCRAEGCSHKEAGSPVWETQPAEPVKVPSDGIEAVTDAIGAFADTRIMATRCRATQDEVNEAWQEVLDRLSRYGQPAQPTGKSPLQVAAKPSVQPGWQLVPVEPSIAMCIRGAEVTDQAINGHAAAQTYAAMLNAAPTPPADGQAQQDAALPVTPQEEEAWSEMEKRQ